MLFHVPDLSLKYFWELHWSGLIIAFSSTTRPSESNASGLLHELPNSMTSLGFERKDVKMMTVLFNA
jgi:hypothetical protein